MTGSEVSKASRKGLLVFDGDCAFCSTWVERLRSALPRFPETVPYQWADIEALGLSLDEVQQSVWYLIPAHRFGGYRAVSALLRSQPLFTLRWAGWIIVTPPFSWFADAGYRLVARYRHLLPGGTPACALPRD